ncbi:MAG: phosphate ABC transporter substrate-binding protein [Planctomycetota bacterium]
MDEKLPKYTPAKGGVSGVIKSVGSDTMNNLMAIWGEGFKKFYPGVTLEVEGKGSSTAPPALIQGSSNFGPMSRQMKEQEIDEFEEQFGYKPTALEASIDLLAVYVHKDNPIKGLTLQQVDAIFSKNRKGRYPTDIGKWGQLDLEGAWANQTISLYGRNSASGTYGFFKTSALFKGDFKNYVKEQPGSSSVVQGVATDKYGIGYSGIGSMTADVRAVPLSSDGETYVRAVPEHVYSGEYPLWRFLYLYVNHKPNQELDPLRREFVRYVFSYEGQQDVVKAGYFPVPAAVAKKNLAAVGLELELAQPVEAGAAKN